MRRETENVRRKTVEAQNETRENNMLTYNEEMAKETPVGAQLCCANPSGGSATNASRSIAALLLGALLFAPQATLAQNECGLQTDPGNPETVICEPDPDGSPFGDYPNGITYTSDGDLTLEVPEDDAVGRIDIDDEGISVTGIGADSIFFDASAFSGSILGGNSDNPVIDYLSDTGDISIAAPQDRAVFGATATRGIRARSTGGGDIGVSVFTVVARSLSVDGGSTAVEAVTAGGDITINSLPSIIDDDSSISLERSTIGIFRNTFLNPGEQLSGIYAQTGGTGNIVMNLQGGGTNLREGSAVLAGGDNAAAIHAVAETGDITINSYQVLNRFSTDNNAEPAGVGILTETEGTATINAAGPIVAETAIRALGNRVVVNFAGEPTGKTDIYGEVVNAPNLNKAWRAVNVGGFDFSALTGGAEVNFGDNSTWRFELPASPSAMLFSDAADTVNVGAGAFVTRNGSNTAIGTQPPPVVVAFGDGRDTLNNAGTILVGAVHAGGSELLNRNLEGTPAELRFEELETFNNSGTIYLGALTTGELILAGEGAISKEFRAAAGPDGIRYDLWYDDILKLPGTDFVGTGDSRIIVDTQLNNIGQTACGAGARRTDGTLPAADCVDLRNGSASGTTVVEFHQIIPGDRGAYNPDGNVIVDIGGGSAEPDAFVTAPESDDYDASLGMVNKGLFIYPLLYDADSQQFKLYGLPAPGMQQAPLLAQAANELWRTATGGWFERRVDQRDIGLDEGLGGGTWFRAARKDHDRDVITAIAGGSQTLRFDNGYSQDDITATAGRDWVFRNVGDSAWLVGAMIGYARANVDFDAGDNRAEFRGMHAGVYGSYVLDSFYVDMAINRTWQDLDSHVPMLDLFPETAHLSTDVNSTGARIESGWRLTMGRFGVEPLAGLTYVTTDVDDVNVPADDPTRFGGTIQLDDAESFRGSLGVRLSVADVLPGIVPTEVSLTARGIEEFEGEAKASIENVGPIDAPVANTFDGTFAQVTGSVSVSNAAKTVAGFLNVDGTFESDYESVGVEAGFRYQW